MIKYFLYGTLNLIYQAILCWLLLFLGSYFNQAFIPNSLMWKNNKPRTDVSGLLGAATIETFILLIEAGVIILLIYFLNKLSFNNIFKKNNTGKILVWTAEANIVLSLCFIGILIWGSFRS